MFYVILYEKLNKIVNKVKNKTYCDLKRLFEGFLAWKKLIFYVKY